MMINLKRSILIVLIGLFAVILTSAKGFFPTIKITDMATDTVIEIAGDDHDLLLEFFLFDRCAPVSADELNLENGYEIQRGSVLMGIFEPFDMLVYYPSEDGKRGYIHYIGLVNARGVSDGSSEYDNRWYYANPRTEPYLRELLFDEPVVQTPFGQAIRNLIINRC